MSDLDLEVVKKHIAEYLESLDPDAYEWMNGVTHRTPVFRNIRKYVEKKMSLPRNSLNDQKKELKKICAVRSSGAVHNRKKSKSCALPGKRRRRRKRRLRRRSPRRRR